jgi:Na+-driven multidrug efflux pump
MLSAVATLMTQALAAFVGIAIFLRGQHGIQLRWSGLKPDWQTQMRKFSVISLQTRNI